MANNAFDSTLVVDTVTQRILTKLANMLAPLTVFSSDFSDEVQNVGQTMRVRLATAAGAATVNPTTFLNTNTTTLDKATVTLDQIVQPFHITAAELGQGFKLENLIDVNLQSFADKIFAVAITPITTTNFGAAVVTTQTITPGSGNLPVLWAAIEKAQPKGLVVNPTIYSQLIATNTFGLSVTNKGVYGFDNGIYWASSFTGAVASLKGFACHPSAIAIAAAVPVIDPAVRQQMLICTQITVPSLGLTVTFTVAGDLSSRTVYATFEAMFGSKAAITSGTMALII